MSALGEVFNSLAQYRHTPQAQGYPPTLQHLFAPVDRVHEAFVALCGAARLSLDTAMFGWDDDEIDALFRSKLEDEHVPVTAALDRTEAAGKHTKKILTRWNPDMIGNALVIGTSSRSAYSHDKLIVIDGQVTICGSTNLSDSAQHKQNNEAVIVFDAVFAAETRAHIAVIHNEMHAQMLRRGELTS